MKRKRLLEDCTDLVRSIGASTGWKEHTTDWGRASTCDNPGPEIKYVSVDVPDMESSRNRKKRKAFVNSTGQTVVEVKIWIRTKEETSHETKEIYAARSSTLSVLRSMKDFKVRMEGMKEGNGHRWCKQYKVWMNGRSSLPSLVTICKRVCRTLDPIECFKVLPVDLRDEMLLVSHIESEDELEGEETSEEDSDSYE